MTTKMTVKTKTMRNNRKINEHTRLDADEARSFGEVVAKYRELRGAYGSRSWELGKQFMSEFSRAGLGKPFKQFIAERQQVVNKLAAAIANTP